jgi:hypothetical protein
MTALRKYLRLESSGLWRETPEARLREVVVGLREATLVLSDPKTEVALSQWSLPAVERLNAGVMPALYGVGAEMSETLEIEDSDMVAALETVRSALERRKPKPGRLRGAVVAGLSVGLLALAVFWLPGQLLDYTAAMLPHATRVDLGKDALNDLLKLTGSPCTTKPGDAALAVLVKRISPGEPLQVLVVRDALQQPLHLPGGVVVLPDAVVQAAGSADALAGYVLAEVQRGAFYDPTRSVLRHAGLIATLRLLTQGTMDPAALDGFGESLLVRPAEPVADEVLLTRFDALGVSSAAYAYALDASGETTLTLIEADPHRNGSGPAILTDTEFQALKAICGK